MQMMASTAMEDHKGSRSQSDYKKIMDITQRDCEYFRSDLDIYGLRDLEAPYSLKRIRSLQMLIRMLSRNKRSVLIARDLIQIIFTVKDVELLTDDSVTLLECIASKFKLFYDLSVTLKVPITDLLRYSSDDTCGKITYYLMHCPQTLGVIDHYIGFEYFRGQIIPRSWFFLLNSQKITHERLQETLLKVKIKDNKFLINLTDIRMNIYECIVQIAYTPRLTYSQKKNMLQMLKSTFGFQNDQELAALYNHFSNQQGQYFECKLLGQLMKRLSFGKKYYLEKLISKYEKDKTQQYCIKKNYMNTEFFKKGESQAKKVQNFIDALDFINKEVKKNQTLQSSDFAVAFLNTFNEIYPLFLQDSDPMKRQNKLMQFIITIELLIKNNIVEDEYFKAALVNMTIYVLKIGIESDETVEISIFSMQILLNAIGLKEAMPYLSKFCSIAVQAYIKFPDKVKIKKYTSKIINFYITDKIRFTQLYFKDLQFLLLKKIQEVPSLKDSIQIISQHLYSSQDDIAENLKYLVHSLQTGNEDIRLLNTTYILELLEQQEQNNVRKILVSSDILKIVYQGILEMPQDYTEEKSRKISIVCAKCIAAIGLCQPFVNDPLTLKATNQVTLVGKKKIQFESQKQLDDTGNPGIIKSDYYNPLTNLQKYKNQSQDNTLELLAVPSLNDLQIERNDVVVFATDLLKKIAVMTNLTDQKPQNFYYVQFLIDMFINHQKLLNHEPQSNQDETIREKFFKQQIVSKSINRFAPCELSEYQVFFNPIHPENKVNKRYIRRLCLHLITKIEEKCWKELFEACVPIIKTNHEFLEMILPYVIYYSLRFNQSDSKLPEDIASIMNKILDSEYISQIVPILKAQDFIKICDQQDKRIFKHFIENDTKFKYVEKLFKLEYDITKAKDQNVVNFIKVIDTSPIIKYSFLAVKKIEILVNLVDKTKKIQGAQKVKAFQRCVYNFEEVYRSKMQSAQKDNQKGFLEVLTQDETIEIVNLHRQLNPEDFDYGIFNSIVDSYKSQHQSMLQDQSLVEESKHIEAKQAERFKNQNLIKQLYHAYQRGQIGEYWKNGQWEQVQEWANGVDLFIFDAKTFFLDRELDNPIQKFEFLIALFVAEYSKGIKIMLTSEDNIDNLEYQTSLKKINYFFELLYHEFILSLDELQGEISYFYKLFLHVLYEIETIVHFLKDTFFHEKERITEALKKEGTKSKRRFEKIYMEFDMNNYFEKLLQWLEERSQMISNSTESLKLIYFVRRSLFKLFERENEYAFYLMKLAKIYRKTSNDVLEVNRLFKECETYAHKIIDYELEYSKYTLKTKNAHEAYQYLMLKHDFIKEKCDNMYKATRISWMPSKVHEKAVLISIELQIRIDPQNPHILKRFDEFLKQMSKNQWEKPVFRYAQYLDELDIKIPYIQKDKEKDKEKDEQADNKKRAIQKIYYYITSLKYGYKYIWQSFPRALELWFDFNDRETDVERINNFMRQELYRLEVFKLASVLQILLSRYAHQKESVRDIIMLVLSKIAVAYPGQCAWWIFHFLHFDQDNSAAAVKKQPPAQRPVITRHDFAKQLLTKIMATSDQTYKKIMECEKIFLELKKLSEKSPPQQNSTTMELPQSLQRITSSSLVMPIEENLSPQLPSVNFKMNYIQTCLVSTTGLITKLNPANMKKVQESMVSPDTEGVSDSSALPLNDFPAFKPKPVLISGFLNEATIMISKEKPKKIGIIGTNKQVYNFLLKCDKYGDLRKEQRFIDFAVLCNKMLENDSESRKRNLRLRTYAIVPLSRSTGLIEWIQNTSTLKSIIGEQWKKSNIKGEMQDIKAKAISLKMGETHEQIWDKVKEEIKPVLGTWMSDHYPSPEIWYEARINFVRSTAIWSIIGYIIGLGDRHGDNILIHQHTGEVTHVDFDCIFEKGARLKIPEIVPFRLTQNIMEAFGLFKEKGVFQRNCEVVMRTLRKNSKNIISFLDSFIHDPLIESQQNIKVEIKEALDIVKAKLHGQIKGDQSGSVTVEEQVEQVILHAINDESLRKMYIGWMSWL